MSIKRLLYNLIDNAIKHGEGRVLVETKIGEDGCVRVLVSNREESRQQSEALLNSLFWAGHGHMSGLGLAVVRRLAEVNGAEVKEEQTPSGRIVEVRFATNCNSL